MTTRNRRKIKKIVWPSRSIPICLRAGPSDPESRLAAAKPRIGNGDGSASRTRYLRHRTSGNGPATNSAEPSLDAREAESPGEGEVAGVHHRRRAARVPGRPPTGRWGLARRAHKALVPMTQAGSTISTTFSESTSLSGATSHLGAEAAALQSDREGEIGNVPATLAPLRTPVLRGRRGHSRPQATSGREETERRRHGLPRILAAAAPRGLRSRRERSIETADAIARTIVRESPATSHAVSDSVQATRHSEKISFPRARSGRNATSTPTWEPSSNPMTLITPKMTIPISSPAPLPAARPAHPSPTLGGDDGDAGDAENVRPAAPKPNHRPRPPAMNSHPTLKNSTPRSDRPGRSQGTTPLAMSP